MDPKIVSIIMLIASVLCMILAVKTVFPAAGASKPNILGYKSFCSFTPVSTLILLWASAVVFILRASLTRLNGWKGNLAILMAVSLVFLAGIVAFFILYRKRSAEKTKIPR